MCSAKVLPRLLVFSSLFPSEINPNLGGFIRERMFRVAAQTPIVVLAPQVWSPIDWILRLKWKSYRRLAREYEVLDGIEIYRPKVLSIPVIFKSYDGFFMAYFSGKAVKKIVERFKPNLVDAHFCYPDGYAASIIAKQLKLPLVITLRGSRDERLVESDQAPLLRKALAQCVHVIAVSDALKKGVGQRLGIPSEKITVVGNGVNLDRFEQMDRAASRARLGIAPTDLVMVSVGNLNTLKGFHRLIDLLPNLRKLFPTLKLVIVGAQLSGDPTAKQLKNQVQTLGVSDMVQFAGYVDSNEMKWYYSAANLFVSATAYEGWANVLLEAMACGLPIVTTRVGGNPQVVCSDALGFLIEFWDPILAEQTIAAALTNDWNVGQIKAYAVANRWEARMQALDDIFNKSIAC